MPDIKLRNQPFDLDFHPSEPLLFSSLLTGEVKAWRYDDQTGESSSAWSIRPTKRAARCVTVSEEGNNLWMGGKGGGLYQINPEDGAMKKERADVHDVPINRVKCINPNLVVSGDDDGVIKFWDPRKEDAIKTYTHHFDYISDFAYFDDKRHLVTTSGDGHLSVIDIRSNKPEPLSISDDQEDELLSIIPIKGGAKAVVGSTLGILSIFNRSKGWQDCVDRIPGHPASIDALVALTPDVIATGSEDGMIRVIQVLPHKFLGVIATHEEYPIERIKLDRNGKWLGSVSHDECIKLTDVENILEDSDDEGGEDESMDQDSDDEAAGEAAPEGSGDEEDGDGEAAEDADSDSDEDMDVQPKKEKKKKGKGGMDLSRADRQTQDSGFFDGL